MDQRFKISAILAVSENGVIGSENALPWRLSNDLKWFKKNTLNKPMIMGRKTFSSLPGILKDRTNIILTRDTAFVAAPHLVAHTPLDALELARIDAKERSTDEVMIIGGGEIYRLFADHIDRYYLTRVHTKIEGDTYFEDLPADNWNTDFTEHHSASEKNEYPHSFQILERIQVP
jgi:dihydrofolate reductase